MNLDTEYFVGQNPPSRQQVRLAVDDGCYAGHPAQRVAADLRPAAAYAIVDAVTMLGLVQ